MSGDAQGLSKSVLSPTILYEDVEPPTSPPAPPSPIPSPAPAPSRGTPPPEFLQESIASAPASPQPTRASRLIEPDRPGSASLLQEVAVSTVLTDSQPSPPSDSGRGENPLPYSNIRIVETTKIAEGLKHYIGYKILFQPHLAPEGACRRRFNDFAWLHAQLRAKHKGVFVPPLPERDDFVWDKFSQAFVDSRRRALETFLQRVVAHPILNADAHVQAFFEQSPERLALLRAGHDVDLPDADAPAAAKSKAGSGGGGGGGGGGYLGWLSSVGSHLPYVASVPPPDPDERFARLGQRVATMHAAFQALAAKSAVLLNKDHETGEAFKALGFGLANVVLTERESEPAYYSQLSRLASNMSVVHDVMATKMSEEGRVVLEEAMRDAVRLCQAAEDLLGDRREALQTWYASRTRKAAPREEAAHRAEVASNEQTVQRLSVSVLAELDRFGILLRASVRHALRNFAALQLKHHAALAAQWRDSLPDG